MIDLSRGLHRAQMGLLWDMDWQQYISLGIVAATAAWLFKNSFGRRKFSFQRDTHCGCAPAPASGGAPSIIYRARKGCRPEVLVKMR